MRYGGPRAQRRVLPSLEILPLAPVDPETNCFFLHSVYPRCSGRFTGWVLGYKRLFGVGEAEISESFLVLFCVPWSRQEKSIVLGFVKAKIAPLPGADWGPFPASWLRLSSLDKAELSPHSWELDCPHLLHHLLGCVVFRDHAWCFSSFLFV